MPLLAPLLVLPHYSCSVYWCRTPRSQCSDSRRSPSCSARAMRHSGYRSVNRAAQEERHSSAAAGWSSQACPGLGQNSASAHRQAHQGLRRQRRGRLLSRPQPSLLQATRPRLREIRVSWWSP